MSNSRTLAATDLVTLPRLDARSAYALAQKLATAAAAQKKLPDPFAEPLAELKAARDALGAALGDDLAAAPAAAAGGGPQWEADHQEDLAWIALHDLLAAWARLDGVAPEAAGAAAALAALFPDGLKFIKLPYQQEWSEAETRLARLADGGHDKAIAAVGGKPFLAFLHKAHAAYGEALGITAARAPAAAPEAAVLRDAKATLADAMKEYLLVVAAHRRKKDPKTGALVDALLEPLATWRDAAPPPARSPPPPPVRLRPPPRADAPRPDPDRATAGRSRRPARWRSGNG